MPRWYLALIVFCVGMMMCDQVVTLAVRTDHIDRLQENILRLLIYTLIAGAMVCFASALESTLLRRLILAAAVLLILGRSLDVTAAIESLNNVPVVGDKSPLYALYRRIPSRLGFGLLLACFALSVYEINLANARIRSRAAELRETNEALFHEIAERHRLEAQLLQAQKLTAVGELAGGVAHNFNNLLTIIGGNLDLARNDVTPAALLKLEEAMGATRRAADLVRQLLTFSRRVPADIRSVDCGVLLAEVASMARQTFDRRIAILVEPADDLRPAKADPSQLHQALLNLCLNARDALLEVTSDPWRSLRIRLDAENFDVGQTHAEKRAGVQPGPFVRLRVADTGAGMTPEVRARAFDPFFTTKEIGKGTGLGLSTVHGIVTQHGGWVEVESVPGQGSTFSIYLPAASHPIESADARTIPPSAGGHETVLVADDDPGVRAVTAMILSEAGYRVIEAGDGQEALAAHDREKGRIDLALLDVSMPGLTGCQALLRMRESDPRLKALFVSGYADSQLLDVQSSASDYLPKPFTAAALLAAVRRALDA